MIRDIILALALVLALISYCKTRDWYDAGYDAGYVDQYDI
jgi:hypothetical protein